MATSGGHLLVPKAMRLIRFAAEKTVRFLRDKLPQAAKPAEAETQPAYARVSTQQPIHRIAAIRQSQSRWNSTRQTTRHFSSHSRLNARPARTSYASSRTAAALGRWTGRTPFASTLRPNLTGGALCRSAGGYGTGSGRIGGARYFSHSPAAPAQVVSNVSQAVRAFWLSGQKARFDGANPRTGEKRFRAVSALQEDARHRMDMSPADAAGSYIDFKVSPTITAIGPLSNVPRPVTAPTCDSETESVAAPSLNNSVVMTNLAVDFARALKDLAAIMNDLKHLAVLGDLPLSLPNSTTLRVRFPGCDADTVEALCRELNIRRGIVGQDEGFDVQNGTDMALLFPFAPSRTPSQLADDEAAAAAGRPVKKCRRLQQDRLDWEGMLLPSSPSRGYSHRSVTSHEHGFERIDEIMVENPWAPSGYSSLHTSDVPGDAAMYFEPCHRDVGWTSARAPPSHASRYEGLEGIYRFLEECDQARR